MDLTEFLTTRWDEEQQLAEAAAKDASPRFNVDGTHWRSSDGEYISCEEATLAVGPYGHIGDAFANHVVAHDPARVLADIAAKRAIVAKCEEQLADRHSNPIGRYLARDTFKLLAVPYADHPDFRPEWRIDA